MRIKMPSRKLVFGNVAEITLYTKMKNVAICSFLVFALPISLLVPPVFLVVWGVLGCLFFPCLALGYGLSQLFHQSRLTFSWVPLVGWNVELWLLSYLFFRTVSIEPLFYIGSNIMVLVSVGFYLREDIGVFFGGKEKK